MTTVALQLSGHLRDLCATPANFEPLENIVTDCRSRAKRCDLFVHTWDQLHAQTPSWHTWYPSDVKLHGASSDECVAQLKGRLKPAAIAVERQPPPSAALGNATWIVASGRHRETHVSLAGLRSAIKGVAAAAALRQRHETSSAQYDVALRLRPDLYRRRNARRSRRSNYRGIPMNQICSVPREAWRTILDASPSNQQQRCGGGGGLCVHGCDDETTPGNKSGDMCFWSAPPTAIDQLVRAWDGLADEYLEANLCWQHRRHESRRALARPPDEAPCAHPEAAVEGSAAELILTAAARREGLGRLRLHGSGGGGDFVPRSAECT
jgi:hypothetical protein